MPHRFKLNDSLGILQIRFSYAGSYIAFNNLLTISWGVNRGTIDRYLACLPLNEEYRREVNQRVDQSLYKNFSSREEQAFEVLKPLLQILEEGHYEMTYYRNDDGEYFKYWDEFTSSLWEPKIHLLFSDALDPDQAKHIETNRKNLSSASLLETSTEGYYPETANELTATQPTESIDEGRVKYFKKEIKRGKRPFAIIINKKTTIPYDEEWSDNYILDGHHKLIAYNELKIYPPLLVITRYEEKDKFDQFDYGLLERSLLPWQVEHIKKHKLQ